MKNVSFVLTCFWAGMAVTGLLSGQPKDKVISCITLFIATFALFRAEQAHEKSAISQEEKK